MNEETIKELVAILKEYEAAYRAPYIRVLGEVFKKPYTLKPGTRHEWEMEPGMVSERAPEHQATLDRLSASLKPYGLWIGTDYNDCIGIGLEDINYS